MKKISNALIGIMFLSLSVLAQNSGSGKNIIVDFVSTEGDGMTLKMTLPLSFVQTLKPQIEQVLQQVRSGEHTIDFQAIWRSVKDSGPTEFVEVHDQDADVKVSTTENHLVIRIDEHREGHQVDVTLPLALGDAIFENLEDIDYDGIIQALLSMEGQDLVKINSDTINGFIRIE